MAQVLRLRALAVATLSILVGFFLILPAHAAEEWKWHGTDYLVVMKSPKITGVCSGDDQTAARGPVGYAGGSIKTFNVGEAVPRNMATSKGYTAVKEVISAERSWVVASLWHQNASKVGSSTLFDESLSWALQSQVSTFSLQGLKLPSDGGKMARDLLNEAEAISGPYDLDIWASYEDGFVRVDNIGVRGRSGWIPGLKAELSVSGPVTGDTKFSITTKAKPVTIDIPVSGPGQVTMDLKVSGLPSNKTQVWEHAKYQDLLIAPPGPTTLQSTGSVDIPISPLSLTIETQVKDEVVQADQIPVDIVTISSENWPVDAAGVPVATAIRAELYGPFENMPEQQKDVPEGIEPLASTHFVATEPGTYQTPELDLENPLEPGYYTWVVSALEQDNADLSVEGRVVAQLSADVVSEFGIASESFKVPQPVVEEPTEPQSAAPSEPSQPGEPAEPTEPVVETIRQLPNTGPTDLIIPALALASMGIGLLLFRHPGQTPTETV